MTKPPSDFWNYPDWLGDSRDNPRTAGHEPFWMREPKVPDEIISSIYDARTDMDIVVIRMANGEVFTTRVFRR